MDYLKSVVPSQFISERGSNLVVFNPGSANVRIGLASQDIPFNIPHCIARYTSQVPRRNVQDQMLSSDISDGEFMEREKAYNDIAKTLNIPFLTEEVANNSLPRKMGRVDGHNPHNSRRDTAFTWTNVYEKNLDSSSETENLANKEVHNQDEGSDSIEPKFKQSIFGDEALKISPSEPYCLRRPIRRGHLNISQHYPMQQVLEDLLAIWEWILTEKLCIPLSQRIMYAAIIVVPETFDCREIKEILSIVLRDLRFSSAVVHQESLAAIFGNGQSTACVVNIGAQVTSVICVEDGVTLPNTEKTLPFGGEDISRCLLWIQRHHKTWPQIHTDILSKPIDLMMLNKLKESYCEIKVGELDSTAVVHSYEDNLPCGSHKTRLISLNVPPMGLFYPMVLAPSVYPPPPRTWFQDSEDMLEDSWQMDFQRRPEMADGFYPGFNVGLPLWENYPVFATNTKPKKEENVGIAEAITSSILSTGRIELQRKLFRNIQLVGGVASTSGLVPAVEDRVLNSIPPNEAIDTVEVLPAKTNPSFVTWKGGVIIGVLDFSREAWIHREDWIRTGIHIGSGRKYKDSYYLQAQAMSYINS